VNAPGSAERAAASANVIRLRHQPMAVGVARRRVCAELAEAGVPQPVLDDLEVVLSELMGNSVRHARPIAGGVLLVGWRVCDGEVSVRVTDGGSSSRVEPRESSPLSDSGRGLQIVERLSRAWGVTEHAGALRTVWAVLSLQDRPPALRLVR
jgi:anti-sigma regulatory factor (Ser/Thr protein kinase)